MSRAERLEAFVDAVITHPLFAAAVYLCGIVAALVLLGVLVGLAVAYLLGHGLPPVLLSLSPASL